MRALIQRVSRARVTVAGKTTGEIGPGMLILLGVTHSDDSRDVRFLAEKCVKLRIFEDDAGKMNRSLSDVGGAALIVSQFTLYGDASHGCRPGYTDAARPEQAEPLYREFVEALKSRNIEVGCGVFGADMAVELVNQGPVTLLLESRK